MTVSILTQHVKLDTSLLHKMHEAKVNRDYYTIYQSGQDSVYVLHILSDGNEDMAIESSSINDLIDEINADRRLVELVDGELIVASDIDPMHESDIGRITNYD